MAIRKLNLMGKSELAEAPFRSLQEVDQYLADNVKTKLDELEGLLRQYQLQFSRSLQKSATEFRINKETLRDGNFKQKPAVKFKASDVDKLVIPNADVLAKNYKIVDELSERVEEMETLYNSTAFKFKGMRGLEDTLKNIKAMKAQADAKLKKALDYLKEVGKEHAPKKFLKLIDETMELVAPTITFAGKTTSLYASITADGELQFTYYIELKGLQDADGGVYPKFYVVFTQVDKRSPADKSKVTPHYYVMTLHHFAAPGKFSVGKRVDSPQRAGTALGMLFDLENVGGAIGTIPHGLDPAQYPKEMFFGHERITKVTGDDRSFSFDFDPSVDEQEARVMVQNLWLDMKGAWAHIKKSQIKVSFGRAGDHFKVRFVLTNLAEDSKINVADVEEWLRSRFSMPEAKIRKIIKELNLDD